MCDIQTHIYIVLRICFKYQLQSSLTCMLFTCEFTWTLFQMGAVYQTPPNKIQINAVTPHHHLQPSKSLHQWPRKGHWKNYIIVYHAQEMPSMKSLVGKSTKRTCFRLHHGGSSTGDPTWYKTVICSISCLIVQMNQ